MSAKETARLAAEAKQLLELKEAKLAEMRTEHSQLEFQITHLEEECEMPLRSVLIAVCHGLAPGRAREG